MRTSHRNFVGLLALIGAMAALSAGCEGLSHDGATRVPGDLPDQEVTDFVVTETDAGHPKWTLYARSAATFTARDLVVAQGVRVDFFDERGARASALTAREGELKQQKRDMTARGDVVLQTAQGWRLSTEELHFLNATQEIVSDRLVRVERNGDVLEGIGFRSDTDLRHFEFRRQVRATVRAGAGGVLESGRERK